MPVTRRLREAGGIACRAVLVAIGVEFVVAGEQAGRKAVIGEDERTEEGGAAPGGMTHA